MPIRHVFFDIDNTLFPSSAFTFKARRKAVREMIAKGLGCTFSQGMDALERIIAKRGPNDCKHFNELVRRINGREDLKVVAAGVIAYHNAKRLIAAYKEVPGVLKSLRKGGYRLYIASEGIEIKQWDKLLRLGIDRFFWKVYVSKRKDAAFFKKILRQEGLAPKECVMVGDRPDKDTVPAMRAGMWAVRIRRGKYSRVEGRAHYNIRSLSQLTGALRKLSKMACERN